MIAEGIQILAKQVSLFTPEYEEKLKALRSDEARVSEMEPAWSGLRVPKFVRLVEDLVDPWPGRRRRIP